MHAVILLDLEVNKLTGVQSPKQKSGIFFFWQHVNGELARILGACVGATKSDRKLYDFLDFLYVIPLE